jgi:predicted hotdog family 3-hydroxylacyl-ACP dehydratase
MFPALDKLMPHRAPMQWIKALTGCTETTATATACFNASDLAVSDGAVLETALVECVAQTVAAAMGYRAYTKGSTDRTPGGMLASVSNFQVHSRPDAGKQLLVEVSETKRFGPMLLVSGVVSCEGVQIASGELMLHA